MNHTLPTPHGNTPSDRGIESMATTAKHGSQSFEKTMGFSAELRAAGLSEFADALADSASTRRESIAHPLIQDILEAHGAPPPASYSHPIRHRDFKVYPNEGWTTQYDRWMYEHDSFDGDEDHRIGVGATAQECRDEIDERFYAESAK